MTTTQQQQPTPTPTTPRNPAQDLAEKVRKKNEESAMNAQFRGGW